METAPSPKGTSRRSRKSIAHLPTYNTFDKENNTVQGITGVPSSKTNNKRLRSKSIGPGGLEALSEDSGNKQKVQWKLHASAFIIANDDTGVSHC